jgi:hypothetical protein
MSFMNENEVFHFLKKKIANFGVSYYRINKSYKQLTDLINK